MDILLDENLLKIDQIKDLYERDKIIEAHALMTSVINDLSLNFDSHPIFYQIQEDFQEIQQLLMEFQDNSDWTTENEGNVKISYKRIPDSPTISVSCESTLEISLFQFIALLFENDLYPEWVPFCKQSYTMKKIHRSRKIIFSQFDVIKVAKRAVILDGYGRNLLDSHGLVLIVAKSVKDLEFNSLTFATINFLGCSIRPIGENLLQVKFISNFDPNIAFLPYSLLNWVCRKMAKLLFKRFANKIKGFNSEEYEKRINSDENQEFYCYLKSSLDEYLSKLKN